MTTDSRNCPDNSLFFALKGANFNGNKFAASALEMGSKYAVVDEPEYADGKNIFLVENCLIALQQLAKCHRRHIGTTIVGITGTNGKTTTKELVSAVLSAKYNVLYTQGNLNNQIGVPLTVLRLKKEHELAVVEMGASHPGDIKELVEIAEPNYGLITNVGHAHILGFGSFEGVVKTKGELYDFIRNNGGKVFRNAENENLKKISNGLDCVLYGQTADCFVSGKLLSSSPFLRLEWNGQDISTNLVGDYNFENVLAAITVGKYFNVEGNDIANAIKNYVPSNNRSQYKQTETNRLIIDAYNANPTSMEASLKNFFKMDLQHKVLILGDMKELGCDSEMEHERIVKLIGTLNPESVFLVGECFEKAAAEGMKTFKDVDGLKNYIKANPMSDKTILIKGSNSTKLINVVDCL